MGGVIGLDYVAVDAAVHMADIDMTPDMFDGLRIMESAATSVLNKDQ